MKEEDQQLPYIEKAHLGSRYRYLEAGRQIKTPHESGLSFLQSLPIAVVGIL
jgi:hypothetical protein